VWVSPRGFGGFPFLAPSDAWLQSFWAAGCSGPSGRNYAEDRNQLEVFLSDQVAEVSTLLESRPAKWMIWEGVPTLPARNVLERMGIQNTVVTPCGNAPPNGDFLTVMRQNVANLESIFR
jgi:hypothetical protein